MILPDGTRLVVVPGGYPNLAWDSRKWEPGKAPAILDAYGRPASVEPIPDDSADPWWEREVRIARECFPEYSDTPWVRVVW